MRPVFKTDFFKKTDVLFERLFELVLKVGRHARPGEWHNLRNFAMDSAVPVSTPIWTKQEFTELGRNTLITRRILLSYQGSNLAIEEDPRWSGLYLVSYCGAVDLPVEQGYLTELGFERLIEAVQRTPEAGPTAFVVDSVTNTLGADIPGLVVTPNGQPEMTIPVGAREVIVIRRVRLRGNTPGVQISRAKNYVNGNYTSEVTVDIPINTVQQLIGILGVMTLVNPPEDVGQKEAAALEKPEEKRKPVATAKKKKNGDAGQETTDEAPSEEAPSEAEAVPTSGTAEIPTEVTEGAK